MLNVGPNGDDEVIDLCSDGEASNSNDASSQAGQSALENLPAEILRRILGNLPMLDLLFIVDRVSRTLNTLISDADFLEWKKLYYGYRYEQNEAKQKVRF